MYRVMIVDDDELCRTLLRVQCQMDGEVEVAGCFSSPAEALRFASCHSFEIAILDVMMPEMTGLDLAQRLSGLVPGFAPIFITASEHFALDAFRLDAASYLVKPVEPEDLQNALSRAKRLCQEYTPDHSVFVRTFSHFDIFVDGSPLKFSRQKSKEILAYLVDRQGGLSTTAQIVGAVWEACESDLNAKTSFHTAFKALRRELEAAGILHILSNGRNQKGIVPGTFRCDFYDLVNGDEQALLSYQGEYMADYSWAEATVAYCNQLKERFLRQITANN